jgi:hypothetical protein
MRRCLEEYCAQCGALAQLARMHVQVLYYICLNCCDYTEVRRWAIVPILLDGAVRLYLQQPGENSEICSPNIDCVLYAIHAPAETQPKARRIFTYSTPFLMNGLPSVRMPNLS